MKDLIEKKKNKALKQPGMLNYTAGIHHFGERSKFMALNASHKMEIVNKAAVIDLFFAHFNFLSFSGLSPKNSANNPERTSFV